MGIVVAVGVGALIGLLVCLAVVMPIKRHRLARAGACQGHIRVDTGADPRIGPEWSIADLSGSPGRLHVHFYGPGAAVFNRPAPFELDVFSATEVAEATATPRPRAGPPRFLSVLAVQTPDAVVHVRLLRKDLAKLLRQFATEG